MKSRYSLLLFVVGLLICGCKKASYLKADADTIGLSRAGASDSIILHSDGDNFTLVSAPDWAKVELRDSVLHVSAPANPGTSVRQAPIVVANDDQRLTLTLTQAAPASYMTVKEKSVTIPQDGSAVTLAIETDGSEVTLDGPDGVTASYDNGTLTIKGHGNNGATRSTTATLTCDTIKRSITIVEQGTVCGKCGGKGTVTCTMCSGEGKLYCPYMDCYYCSGRGRAKCPACHGKGK